MKRGEQELQFEQQMNEPKHQKIGPSSSQESSIKTPEPVTQPQIFLQDTLARLFEADKSVLQFILIARNSLLQQINSMKKLLAKNIIELKNQKMSTLRMYEK